MVKAAPASAPQTDPDRHLGWVRAIARRDEAALAALYDDTVARVHGIALRIARNPVDAEEVVSDTYHQAWRDAGLYSPERGPVVAWLVTIARSRAIDLLRRRDAAVPVEDPAALAPAESGDDPQDLLAATRERRDLHDAIAALEPLDRQLLALAFFRGLAHGEIAEQARLPLGTVKSRIRRALAQLRPLLPA